MLAFLLSLALAAPRTEGALVIDGVPPIPAEVSERTQQYGNTRGATLFDWAPDGSGVLIGTRFGETTQAHFVAGPGADRRQLTFFDEPVAGASFDPGGDGRSIVVSRDVGGREDWQIYRYDLRDGRATLLTDGGASRNERGAWANAGGRFAFTSNRRNKTDFDIYVMEPTGPRLVKETQGDWSLLAWSPGDERLLVRHEVSITRATLHVLDLATGALRDLDRPGAEVAWRGGAVFLSDDTVLAATDDGQDFLRLVRIDLKTGKRTVLTGDVPWDVEALALSKDRTRVAYAVNEGGRSTLYTAPASDPAKRTRVALPPGVIGGVRWAPSGDRLAVSLSTATSPSDVHVVESGKVTRWTASEVGGLDPARFVAPELVSVSSFDGTKVPMFVYRPAPKAPPKDGSAPKPAPVVLRIHGGPEAQARDGFDPFAQYLVGELGVAVIAPNVRGSNGYGRKYVSMDNGKRREDAVKDIGAILDWIATRPELDKDRVAVMGASYGGYMTLASLVHYADRLRCGVDTVGISNFVSFLENTESYRRDLRRVEYGDERDPAMRAFLQSISPSTNAARIRDPLFVVQGKNDPRVPMSEAEQIVATVRNNGGTVWYLLANDEGHGFRRKSNRDYLDDAVTLFFQEHLLK